MLTQPNEILALLNLILIVGLGIAVLLHWRDSITERKMREREGTRERAEFENWRYKEVEPSLKTLSKMEGILLGLNGNEGMRADVRRLNELRSRDTSVLQRIDYQVHILVKTLAESSENEEVRKRLKAIETVPSNFLVNPP